MLIALFGTSADPPTTGHLDILRWLTHHYDWVAVWAADNPFKQHPVALPHRHAMLDCLVAEVQEQQPNIGLYPELSHPRTIVTVQRAQQRWPQAQFTLVIGSDLLAQLPKWYQAQQLLQQVALLVIPRPDYPITQGLLDRLQDQGAQVQVAPIRGLPVSSTAYREQGNLKALPPAVQAYIRQQRLYAWQDVAAN